MFTHEPPDRFALTSFGRTVVQRYGKTTESGLLVNMFDVRVGAYGPVWNSIGDLVSGRSTYGEEVQRGGSIFRTRPVCDGSGMGPSLLEALDDQSGPVVEMGVVETGLLEHVGRHRPDLELWALDRSERAIAKY